MLRCFICNLVEACFLSVGACSVLSQSKHASLRQCGACYIAYLLASVPRCLSGTPRRGGKASSRGVDVRRRSEIPRLETEIRMYRSKAADEFTDAELDAKIATLNPAQKHIFDSLHRILISAPVAPLIHIDAPAGCGKSYLCSTFAASLRRTGGVVLTSAATGIASLNFFFGRTVHSLFAIPIDMTGIWTCSKVPF